MQSPFLQNDNFDAISSFMLRKIDRHLKAKNSTQNAYIICDTLHVIQFILGYMIAYGAESKVTMFLLVYNVCYMVGGFLWANIVHLEQRFCCRAFPKLFNFLVTIGSSFLITVMSLFFTIFKAEPFPNNKEIRKLQTFSQSIHHTISFIMSILILLHSTTKECKLSLISLISLGICIIIQSIYYAVLFSNIIIKIEVLRANMSRTMSHRYTVTAFIIFILELLMLFIYILGLFYIDIDDVGYKNDNMFVLNGIAVFSLVSLPFSMSIFYCIYIHKYIHPLLNGFWTDLFSITSWLMQYKFNDNSIKTSSKQQIVDKLYCVIHIASHHMDCYELTEQVQQVKSVNDKYNARLSLDIKYESLNTIQQHRSRYKTHSMVRHDVDDDACFIHQMQYVLMENIDLQYVFIKNILKHKSTGCYCRLLQIYYVFTKLVCCLMPIYWFIAVYIMKINRIDFNGYQQWFIESDNKFEHMLISMVILLYCIVLWMLIFYLYYVVRCEYYFGFIRMLCTKNDVKDAFRNIDLFYQSMLQNKQQLDVLVECGFMQDIAMIIVNYARGRIDSTDCSV